jgi:ATP/ADP translocase
MDALSPVLLYALVVAPCLILVALLVIVLCQRDPLGQGVKDLAATLLLFALAFVLWPFIRWPSSHILDQMMFVSCFVLVLLGVGRLAIFTVRCARFRQQRKGLNPKAPTTV